MEERVPGTWRNPFLAAEKSLAEKSEAGAEFLVGSGGVASSLNREKKVFKSPKTRCARKKSG